MTLELRVSCLSPPRLEQALGRDDRREMRLAINVMREGKKSLSPTLRSPNGCQVCRRQHGAQRFHGDREIVLENVLRIAQQEYQVD